MRDLPAGSSGSLGGDAWLLTNKDKNQMTELSQPLTSFWLLSQTFTHGLSLEPSPPVTLLALCSRHPDMKQAWGLHSASQPLLPRFCCSLSKGASPL